MKRANRILAERAKSERNESELRTTLLKYDCDTSALSPSVREKFLQLHLDLETDEWLDGSVEESWDVLRHYFHGAVQFVLGPFMARTSINGLLRRGRMFVFSKAQVMTLLGDTLTAQRTLPGAPAEARPVSLPVPAPAPAPAPAVPSNRVAASASFVHAKRRLLDIGAGDGSVTDRLVAGGAFDHVTATEVSRPMLWRLQARAYTAVETENVDMCEELKGSDGLFHCVACLNVLDRCEKPLTLVRSLRRLVSPDGVILLAVVLPYKPAVEHASLVGWKAPEERIIVGSASSSPPTAMPPGSPATSLELPVVTPAAAVVQKAVAPGSTATTTADVASEATLGGMASPAAPPPTQQQQQQQQQGWPAPARTAAKTGVVAPCSCYECNVKRTAWETSVNQLVETVFEPSGLSVVRFARLPYLSCGDLTAPYYKLDDAVFVLKPVL